MSDLLTGLPDLTRILFDLQQVNDIAQACSGCLDPGDIARQVTEGLIEKFDCAFTRIWLLDEEQATLKLVASSGLYTHTDGFFSRVPMGAFKVGKIAQNRVSFLSNNLAAEPWVGNREWAIAQNIRGFAGYPLATKDRVVGVLAIFSHNPMEPEFLEALQTLCTMVTIALDTAIHYQKAIRNQQASASEVSFNRLPLSEQLASILRSTRLTLVGTEQALSPSLAYVMLSVAELLDAASCTYCRLIYMEATIALEAIVPTSADHDLDAGMATMLSQLSPVVVSLGGSLQTQRSVNQRSLQIALTVPYKCQPSNDRLRIQCRLPLLQLAFTHLALSAGLTIVHHAEETVPLLTDDLMQIHGAKWVIWVQQAGQVTPKPIKAQVDLAVSPDQLRQAIAAVMRDQWWGIDPSAQSQPVLSERESAILALLTQGHRDREIADRLIISESTVKFHMNNILAKLNVRTRYQAIHQAIVNGWIP